MTRKHKPSRPIRTADRRRGGAIVAAALALPGVWAAPAHADSAPEHGSIAFKYLHYQDSQPGWKRMTVNAPSAYLLLPIGAQWSVEASAVVDSLSGASPRWQSQMSGASVYDVRRAADVKVTRYFERSSYALGVSHSAEADYISNALSLSGTWSSDDNNRTWAFGVGAASDRIDPTNGGLSGVSNETRKTIDLMFGVTQAVSSTDIAQLNLTYSRGKGYYSEPYKTLDVRPRERSQLALLGRWNHYLEGNQSTLRGSYRFYRDNFGINAHALQGEWVKPLSESLTLTPLLRYYSQRSANFYVDAEYDAAGFPIFPDLAPGQFNSGDQRLSAFGAVTLGLKAEYKLSELWAIDFKYEVYEQRSNWRIGGPGSPGLDPFYARFLQLGVSRTF